MADKKADVDEDPRYMFVCDYLVKTMRLKSDKWPKMIGNEEYRVIIHDFLTNPKVKTMIFNLNPAGLLIPSTTYPPNPKTKSVYFIKRREEAVTMDNLGSLLLWGDMAPNPVEELSVLMEEVFVPLLSNAQNQKGWPRCIAEDVMKHIHAFRGTVYQIKGKMTGQTLLPMPVGIEKVYQEVQRLVETQGKVVNLNLKTAIEGAVIKWAHQISDVLNENSDVFFADDKHPGPLVEITFWNQRLRNLESLYDQLRDPRVKKMTVVLEITESSYTHTYRSFFRNVVAAVAEARDICLYLNPLTKMFENYESSEFMHTADQLEPILHCICLLWSNSNYYCLSQRIVTLLKMFGNTIVEQAIKYLDPGSTFQGDQEETLKHLVKTKEILINFLSMYERYRKKLPSYFKIGVEPKPWSFNPEIPFDRIFKFMERLNILIDFFEDVIDFLKLDRIELAGIKGRNLGFKVADLMDDFHVAWMTFSTATYDPLDPDHVQFLSDCEAFKLKAYDYDKRMASIFTQAFDECSNIESLFKLTSIMGSLAERPVIKAEIESKYQRIINSFNEDLNIVKEIYDDAMEEQARLGYLRVDRYWAQVSGTICWINKMKGRIDYPVEPMKLMDYPILEGDYAKFVMSKRDQMTELLEKLQSDVLSEWCMKTPHIVAFHLSKPMLLRNREDLLLNLNFDPALVCALREIRYLNAIGPFNIPEELDNFFARNESLFMYVQNLNQLIGWYNHIRKKSRPVEFALFEDEIILIDLLLDCGIKFLDWNSPEAELFILKSRYLIKMLYDRVTEAQENAATIYQLIFQWSNEPLYERPSPKHLLGLDDRLHKVRVRYTDITQVGEDIHELTKINYHLLLDIPIPEEEEPTGPTEVDEEGEEEEEGEQVEVGKKKRIYRKKRQKEPIPPQLAEVLGLSQKVEAAQDDKKDEKQKASRKPESSRPDTRKGVESARAESRKGGDSARGDPKKGADSARAESKKGGDPGKDDQKKGGDSGKDDQKKGGDSARAESRKGGDSARAESRKGSEPTKGGGAKGEDGKGGDGKGGGGKGGDGKGGGGKGGDGKGGDGKGGEGKGGDGKGGDGKGGDGKGGDGKGEDGKAEGAKGDAKKAESAKGDAKKAEPEKEGGGKGEDAKGDAKKGEPGKEGDGKGDSKKKGGGKGDPKKGGSAKGEAGKADAGKKQDADKKKKPPEEAEPPPPPPIKPPDSFTLNPSMPPRSEKYLAEQRKKNWEAYLDYIDQVVTAGILSSIACSIGYLIDETDTEIAAHHPPLFEVALELQEPDLVFVPSLGEDSAFLDLITTIEDEIFGVGKLIPRIAQHKEYPDYEYEALGCSDLRDMREELIVRTKLVMFEAISFSNSLMEYSYLWLENRQENLTHFLKFGRTLTKDEQETLNYTGDLNMLGIPDRTPTTVDFKQIIDHYEELYKKLEAKLEAKKVFYHWFQVDCKPFKNALLNIVCKWGFLFKNHLYNHVLDSISELEEFIVESEAVLTVPVEEDDYDALVKVMDVLKKIRDRQYQTDEMFKPLWDTIELLKDYEVEFTEDTYIALQELPEKWTNLKKLATAVKQMIAPLVAKQVQIIRKRIMLFDLRQTQYKDTFRKLPIYSYGIQNIYDELDSVNRQLVAFETLRDKLTKQAELFEVNVPEFQAIIQVRKELKTLKILWDYVYIIDSWFIEWQRTAWKKIDVEGIDFECKRFGKELRSLDKEVRSMNVYVTVEGMLKNMMTSLRAVTELQNPAIRERHWIQLMQATKVKFVMTDSTTLADLLDLHLHEFEEEVKTIVDKSVKEMAMEKTLRELETTWKSMEFDKQIHARTNTGVIVASEELIETLENDQNQLQNMMSSKFIDYFYTEVSGWQQKLSNADQVINIWTEVQRSWQHLESIFIGSEDIRSQLPEDSKRFESIDKNFRGLLSNMMKDLNVVRATNKPGLIAQLEELQKQLTLCEKALSDYLETKRLIYPRFYFVSSADLLDILSNGNQPDLVARHLTKLYDSLGKLKFVQGSKSARGMFAKDGEYVEFKGGCDCSGKVEVWLNRVTDVMRKTLRQYFAEGVHAYDEMPRDQFLFAFPAQVALCGTQIWWTTEVNMAFERLEEGYENALKDYNKKQVYQLSVLITLLCGDLSKGDRQKIMTVCTIDVHSRDVISKMIALKVESSTAFQWQAQLRHRWDFKIKDCFGNICDAQFRYDYEYLGCTPRLVITPLTDRCYITLTQSLHLIMGGAPAGPAGTGKTETTKDLGRALGIMVYVFNCSEQMDYKSCGNIYKGLAQTGAWGCFDEFNRISVEVLSVVAVQVKSVQDAIKSKKQKFNFMGEMINLVPTVGIFITMNPGYAGRTELPENLKALFRPCAMVVPDFELICEIMLVAEGFQEARLLARKFITLYTLCRELLSKQDHYDWGLRAIKSVLVVAGSLKRGDRQRPEDQVLMRALRDFNIPKIVTDDLPVFMGLIGDLFPALDVPRKRDVDFEKAIKGAALDLKLQPEDNFILKCVQLEELFDVRHSVFIIGFAGTGKTQVWKTLNRTYANQKRKPWYNDLNPKAVTNDELFGVINPATREWRDGLFSVIMRDQANMGGDGPKWIVLDGDIDPMWIESLNTLMDDNKVLTLASNERIALTASMRLLFEISNLRTATPATVSRAGILYINPQDLGWNPFVSSWLDTRKNQSEKAQLNVLFDKYVPPCLEALRVRFKKITPLPEINHVQILCQLLNCLLTPANVPNDCPKEWYEIYFAWACVWAFGASMFQDQLLDWRNEFNKWWVNEFKVVKFPTAGTVFHYFIDQETKKFLPWTEKIVPYEFDPDIPLQAALVNTSETTRIRYFIDILIQRRVPVMLVGNAGSGKSVIVSDKMNNLTENYAVTNVPFNFYTTSEMLQKVLEKPLEKKAGRNYGPPGSKNMIYFIDDMNMPEVDTYGTVQPHTLIRQHIDYSHWYDRVKLSLKEIHNCQYISCMNPTAGSFTIDPRLQRHFAVFAVSLPSGEALFSIYEKILTGHLTLPSSKFHPALLKIVAPLVTVALQVHQKMAQTFLPTAIKFHYVFNMRDLANIFQGILYSTPECVPNTTSLIRLWYHEANRVYCDKLIEAKDVRTFQGLITEIMRKGIEELNEVEVFATPLLFCHFAEGIGESKYLPINTWAHLNKLLEEALSQYNDLVAAMNLVLFEDAMHHVCRINRILEAPRGNALLVGVGGSGKQSLSRLASFISTLEVYQIQLRKGYALVDLKADLSGQYMKAGVRGMGIVFLMTDAQVAEEKFLVVINDCLASGEVPELFADDEVDNIINIMRPETRGAGLVDTRENCWKFFIEKVRRLLKVVLCFSPVGSTLRIRSRKFPAVVNCTAIDWFHEWPHEALISVSFRFLEELEALPDNLRDPVSRFMAAAHTSVNEMSQAYLLNDRRYNYTTPKSFLEQISLYFKLLTEKTNENVDRIQKLENGLTKLVSTSEQVDGLKEVLAKQEVVLAEKNAAADALINVVGAESDKVAKEKAFAAEEEERVRAIEEDVSAKQKICEEDLAKAEPALLAAQSALDTLDKTNLTEYKSFGTPPPGTDDVAAAVMVLFAPKGKIPRMQDRAWKNCKVMMGKVDTFLDQLKNYDKENMQPEAVKAVQYYLDKPDFDPERIKTKSKAAAGLCSWVINIIKFYEVFVFVEPKRQALQKANRELQEARDKLKYLKEKLADLEEKLGKLTAEFDAAMAAKMKCQAEADATALTINLANRLVGGLASENVRWRQLVANLKIVGATLPGDILLVTAFISYVGCFTKRYRQDLMDKHWIPFIRTVQPPIPMTGDIDPLSLLTDDAQIAKWNNEGLPNDRMSVENATVLVNSARWPLMIDPQLQGIKWIKNKYGDELKVVRLGQKSYLDVIEMALSEGSTVLIEYIGESVDAVLEPLLGRALIRKGKAIKIGDKEMDFNPKFRLILQTKLANPHYKPEMQAQTTLINFTVTRDGLEEQLLGGVVKAERPDLESLKTELTQQQNTFKITLKFLEDDLLYRLSSAGDDILSDVALVENLERTKKTAAEITVKVAEAKITSVKIDEAREQYRTVATRASILYFVLNDLSKINLIYQFSLKAFNVVFQKALASTEPADNLKQRVANLLDCVTFYIFMYTNRALFEVDKLIFKSQMTIQIFLASKEIEPEELDFLLRFPANPNVTSPVDFLTNLGWGGVKTLSSLPEFKNLDKDIEGSAKRWKKFVESEKPEREKFPQEWKNKSALQRLCMMRCLRPDRMTYAIGTFIEEKLGLKYAEARTVEFAKSYEESTSTTPIFFILSAGVDPLKDVEKQGRKCGFTMDKKNFYNISLGQGQEVVAEDAMETGSKEGHWVMLQNVHLVKNWLPILEKKMEQSFESPHDHYRLFISAEPAPAPEFHIIPQGILESAIKITNEPPTGMLANLHKALDCFTQETLEMCTKEAEFKAVLFALCYFHAVVAERRKFGAQGWNRVYPFNLGDLTISVSVLYNYLENNSKVPWEDLRYLFGEIMYGGHITDDWDRRLCRTYLEEFMRPELLDGDLHYAPGFLAPPNSDYVGYHTYIDDYLPSESPNLYGLHINAEIGFLTTLSENLFRMIFEMQPRDAGKSSGATMSREDKVKVIIDDIMDKAPEEFNVADIMAKIEDKTPYILVAFQEMERMNILFREIKRSLKELDLGLKGELTISTDMESLMANLFLDQIPAQWAKRAYPSLLPLGGWYADLITRLKELEAWAQDFNLPAAVWLAGFFNPQSFLTAIMQSTARKNEWPLDKMCLHCEVTKKSREEFTGPPREGANIAGLYMEGARWDVTVGGIVESKIKELFPMMPVIYIKAITQDKQDLRGMYECPVYKTRQRGPTFVWTFNLKTRERPGKWTLGGVALLLGI